MLYFAFHFCFFVFILCVSWVRIVTLSFLLCTHIMSLIGYIKCADNSTIALIAALHYHIYECYVWMILCCEPVIIIYILKLTELNEECCFIDTFQLCTIYSYTISLYFIFCQWFIRHIIMLQDACIMCISFYVLNKNRIKDYIYIYKL